MKFKISNIALILSRLPHSRFGPFILRNKLICAWLSCLAIITLMSVLIQPESYVFYGITESREMVYSPQHTSEVTAIYVRPGDHVKEGQMLALVSQPELSIKINDATHRIEALNSQLAAERIISGTFRSKGTFNSSKDSSPVGIELQRVKEELRLLRLESEGLAMRAAFNGVVGSINVKAGEKVAAFVAILSLHEETPTLVRGFLHESTMNRINTSDELYVSSITSDPVREIATVSSIDNRIDMIPERLVPIPGQKLWGRAVFLSLPSNSEFLLGQKVIMHAQGSRLTRIANRIVGWFERIRRENVANANPERTP